MRTGILVLMVISANCFAQNRAQTDLPADTVVLQEVIVRAQQHRQYLSGSSVRASDSTLHASYSGTHLGDLLAWQLPIYFRKYGNGMLSGISMRGTSPQHTAVLWNGININSFSLGQADFSVLPNIAFDNIDVIEGGSSARIGSGAFGGAVLLESGSLDNIPLMLTAEAGSFGRFFGSIRANIKINKLTIAPSVYRQQAQNDFPVQCTGDRQQHAAFEQQGFLQYTRYDFNDRQSLQADYWIHQADRQIQPTIGSVGVENNQQDINHRLSIQYRSEGNKDEFTAAVGMISDNIVYNNNPGHVLRWTSSGNYQWQFTGRWTLQTGAEWNHIIGKLSEYEDNPVEDRVDIFLSGRKDFGRINISVNLRKPFITSVKVPLLPYIGTEWLVLKKERLHLSLLGNASRNFRAPTLNDRYWQGAGNPDLLPEQSYAGEAGLKIYASHFSIHATGFYQLVDQWIQWKPEQDGVFKPINEKKVAANGVETMVQFRTSVGITNLRVNASYQYTRSIIKESTRDEASIRKQLWYTPEHTANAYLIVKNKSWSLIILNQFASTRYTDDHNTQLFSLEPYVLTDVTIGKSFRLTRHSFAFNASVKNLLDIDYQQYAGRAMPGRNFNFSIHYQLTKSK